MTVWIYPLRLNNIIIDYKANLEDNERGYHWQTNNLGEQILMVGDDS